MEKFEIKISKKEEPEKEVKNLYIETETLDRISNQLKESISGLENNIFKGNIDIFESMREMKKISISVVNEIISSFSTHLNIKNEELPFTIFFFGSPSRNIMLPNSDLDIGIVFEKNCPDQLKDNLKNSLNSLPFDKIDILDLDSIDEMKKENCPSIVEYKR